MSKHIEITCGIHAVRHALNKVEDILEMWTQADKKKSKGLEEILEKANNSQISVQLVNKKTLDKITDDAPHQGVAIRRRAILLDSAIDLDLLLTIKPEALPIFLVLDEVQDMQNLGACLRVADAFGARAVITPKSRSASLNTTVRRIASGATENTPLICVTNLARCFRKMQQAGIWIIGTDPQSKETLYQADLTIPIALVVGSESHGIRQNTRKHCDKIISIPMLGIVESMNVSVATGIFLYEAQRQRYGRI